jgi:gag-polypeptide of LTR copia-type
MPDETDEPRATCNWKRNDFAILQLINSKISDTDRDLISHFAVSKDAYDFLSDRHQKQGIFPQLMLLQEVFCVRYVETIPLPDTMTQIQELVNRIWDMGIIMKEHLFCVAMFYHLQPTRRYVIKFTCNSHSRPFS